MREPDAWDAGSPRNRKRTRESERQVRRLLRDGDPLGVPDDIGPAVIGRVFRDWRTDQIYAQDIPSGNQPMPARVVRLHL
jgi:hypothetical protein